MKQRQADGLGQGGSVRSKQYLAARLKKNLPSAIHNWFNVVVRFGNADEYGGDEKIAAVGVEIVLDM